jgi:H+/gluconate symporter-like permease
MDVLETHSSAFFEGFGGQLGEVFFIFQGGHIFS